MFPELAPEEDTWYHEKQMSFMKDVLAGEANAYNPNLSDKKVKEILNVSPKETIKLSSINNKTFYTDWKAHHGRIGCKRSFSYNRSFKNGPFSPSENAKT